MAPKTLWQKFVDALSKTPEEAYDALKNLLTNKSIKLLRPQTAKQEVAKLCGKRTTEIKLDCKRDNEPGYLTISIRQATDGKKTWYEVCMSSTQFGGRLNPPEKTWTKMG